MDAPVRQSVGIYRASEVIKFPPRPNVVGMVLLNFPSPPALRFHGCKKLIAETGDGHDDYGN
jgi:hypothetical protein